MRSPRKTVNVTGLPEEVIRAVEVLVSQLQARVRGADPARTPKDHIGTGSAFVNEAQALARRYRTPGVSVVDSFIEGRRKEAKREADGR
jgi:hypothetical protein